MSIAHTPLSTNAVAAAPPPPASPPAPAPPPRPTPAPATTAAPPPASAPQPSTPVAGPTSSVRKVYYKSCKQAKAAGAAPLHKGDPGYRKGLDDDHNGTACEK
ncbi:MAG: excalibur calcium-binding domain-containing protein [Nocardia sp.]|nr:excalibur calcium-binding domain-containing protein [Nocardia sp.]